MANYVAERNIKTMLKKGINVLGAHILVLEVKHQEFINQGVAILRRYGRMNNVFFDIKYAFNESETDERL